MSARVVGGADALQQVAGAGESVQHLALRVRQKKELLIVLPVNIRQVRRQVFEQGGGYRAAADERPRFPAGEDLALDEQFALFAFQPRGLQ